MEGKHSVGAWAYYEYNRYFMLMRIILAIEQEVKKRASYKIPALNLFNLKID